MLNKLALAAVISIPTQAIAHHTNVKSVVKGACVTRYEKKARYVKRRDATPGTVITYLPEAFPRYTQPACVLIEKKTKKKHPSKHRH